MGLSNLTSSLLALGEKPLLGDHTPQYRPETPPLRDRIFKINLWPPKYTRMTECFPHTLSYFTIRDRLTSLKHTYSYRAKSRENAVVQLCLFSLTNVRKRTCSFVCRGSLTTNSTRSNSGWSHRHLVNKNKSEAWRKQLQHAVPAVVLNLLIIHSGVRCIASTTINSLSVSTVNLI